MHLGHVMDLLFLGIAAIWALFYAFMFATLLLEKRYLAGDVEPATEPPPYKPSRYWLATKSDAVAHGLIHCGDYSTAKKTSIVKGLQSMWITEDSLVICSIVSASQVRKTVLRTRLSNGRIVESSDFPATADFTGGTDRSVLFHAGLGELLSFHRARIEKCQPECIPFDCRAVLQEFEQIDVEMGHRLVAMKLAHWANEQQTTIRMTVRGALRYISESKQTAKVLQTQKERLSIPRAGSLARARKT